MKTRKKKVEEKKENAAIDDRRRDDSLLFLVCLFFWFFLKIHFPHSTFPETVPLKTLQFRNEESRSAIGRLPETVAVPHFSLVLRIDPFSFHSFVRSNVQRNRPRRRERWRRRRMISGTVIGPSLAARGHVLPAAQWSSIDASANNYKIFVFCFFLLTILKCI